MLRRRGVEKTKQYQARFGRGKIPDGTGCGVSGCGCNICLDDPAGDAGNMHKAISHVMNGKYILKGGQRVSETAMKIHT